MSAPRIKTGQNVVVIRGSHTGKRGKVLRVLPSKGRAIVEGIALMKRHTAKSQDNPQGAIVEREGSIHLSNLMDAEAYDARRAKKEGAAR